MTRWANQNLLRQGPKYLQDNATRVLLISSYSAGQNYATVTGNQLGTATISSTDFSFSTSGSDELLTFAGKAGVATATGTPSDAHLAFTNGSNEVIYVTDETTDQGVTNENPLQFPSLTYVAKQPSAPA